MATAVRMVSSSSLVASSQLVQSSSFHGQNVSCRGSIPSMRRLTRIVVSRQQEVETSAKGFAAIVGEKNSQRLQYGAIIAMNALYALPSFAEEEPKGKIFDFNLTLPIIVVEFLLLMVALDNIWFKPVSKVMDSRDEDIRKKLVGVRDNSSEIKALQTEAEGLIKAARAETSAALAKMKKETAAELDEKLQAARARIEKELATAVANLLSQKEATLRDLDSQVTALSEQIVKKVMPFKV
eukprot:TRINITY_DN26667_c0_g1_i1.p1 TRINITY_DN26667_c0_g1~~TRINITY_DN26667_c0_g1_i1.p1  ORF type:complete len:239 (-),score=60.11 TRINITY_DN26667_c0_g1_i1:772-1488(-)